MSRYKIATKTDKLRHLIAKEVFGEIEHSDGVRDIPSWEIFEKCLEQHKLIKDLEHRLSNCIEPKFKVGDKVYHFLCGNEIKEDFIESNHHLCSLKISRFGIYEDYLFATEEEAKAKLEKMKNG